MYIKSTLTLYEQKADSMLGAETKRNREGINLNDKNRMHKVHIKRK